METQSPPSLSKSSRSSNITQKMTTMATQGAWLRMAATSSSSSPKSVAKLTVTSSELGFLTSQLSGVRISHGPSDVINRISAPSFPGLQPIVARNFPFSLHSVRVYPILSRFPFEFRIFLSSFVLDLSCAGESN